MTRIECLQRDEPDQSAAGLLAEFERFIHRDPGRRGLISSELSQGSENSPRAVDVMPQSARLCAGQLAAAAGELASNAVRVAIVTGFFIPGAEPPAAETDGPPGSLFLAECLRSLGIDAVVVTDLACAAAVRASADAIDFPKESLVVAPLEAQFWCDEFLKTEAARGLTHLISVERVGPSHTPESVRKSGEWSVESGDHAATSDGANSQLDVFLADVAVQHHNRCHNMRGVCIDEHTAPLHLLFERLTEFIPNAATIGIGDGGNEIGMGSIPWAELARRLSGEQAGRVPCRVACDFTIVAGTSNWGAMALAASVCVLRDRLDVLKPWTQHRHHAALQHLVVHGPAVDGITGRREATVDGLPFLTYIQPWEGIRRLLGWND